MNNGGTSRRLAAVAAAVALSALALGACGSSKSTTSAKADSGATTTTLKATDAAFCDAWFKADTIANQGPQGDPNSPPSPDAVKAFAVSLQGPLADTAETAPESLKQPVSVLKDLTDSVAAGGDASKFDPETNPELAKASNTVDEYAYGNCGWNQVTVKAVDYAFQDFPKTLKAGRTSFKFVNEAHDEEHEMSVVSLKPGAKVTIPELKAALEKDPMAAEQKYGDEVDFSVHLDAKAGGTTFATVDMKPGTYLGACFIPLEGKPDGMPHVTKGMDVVFEVK